MQEYFVKDMDYFKEKFLEFFPSDVSEDALTLLDPERNLQRDIYINDFYDYGQIVVFELGKVMADYASVLHSEYTARKQLANLKKNSKNFLKSERNVKGLFTKRSNLGSRIKVLVSDVVEGQKLLDKLSVWCNSHKVVQSDYYKGIVRDFNNIIKTDIVRRRSLDSTVKGGPKMLISFNASKIGVKCCRRLSSNLGFMLNNNNEHTFLRFCEDLRSKEYAGERQKRCIEILNTCDKSLNVNSSLSPGIFYRATFAYLWKRFNEAVKNDSASIQNCNFDDRDIVNIMMSNGYSDAAIIPALRDNSLYYVGLSDDYIKNFVKECRGDFDRNKMRQDNPVKNTNTFTKTEDRTEKMQTEKTGAQEHSN